MGYLRNKINNIKNFFRVGSEDKKQQNMGFVHNGKNRINENRDYDDTLVYNGLKNTSAPGLTARKKVSDKYLLEFEFLKRIKGSCYDNILGNFPYWEEVFVEKTVRKLEKNGFIECVEKVTPLESYKMVDLKQLLQDNHLESKGNKKAVLIERIEENIKEEVIKAWNPPRILYGLTEKGMTRYNELLLYKEDLFNDTFDAMMQFAENRDFQSAYKCMCRYEIKQIFERGLHSSSGLKSYWELAIENGLSSETESVYNQYTDYIGDSLISSFAIVFYLFGTGYKGMQNKIERYINAHQIDREITESKVICAIKIYYSIRDLIEYREIGIDKYKVLSVCDAHTCKNCAHLDGKVFKVSDAKIGDNMPPFCNNCRCTTVSVIDSVGENKEMRSVRDENGKSITVPFMTYKEWSKKYAPEKYKEYFESKKV